MTSRIFAVACAAVAIAFGSYNTASAQGGGNGCDQLCLPNGTPVTCQVLPNGTKVWVDAAGNQYNSDTQGTGSFQVTQCDPAVCELKLDPTSINITSNAGSFGIVTTVLDPTRISTPATVTALASGAYDERFSFFAETTVSSQPGRVFRSVQELTFVNGNVLTFNPHQNEQFKLENAVDFEDVNAPGVIAFTLQQANITLN